MFINNKKYKNMDALKKFSFVGLVITLVLTSCTMQKRLYMDGYHIESLTTKHKEVNRSFKNNLLSTKKKNKLLQSDENYTITIESQTTASPIIEDNIIVTHDKTDIVASADNKQIILSQKEKHTLSNYNVKTTILSSNVSPKQSFKRVFNSRTKTFTKSTNDDEPSNKKDKQRLSGFALAGFICSTVGLLLALIIGWPFLLGTLGTIFSAIGLGETSKGKKGKGFAIAGLVMGILAIIIFWIWVVIVASI